MVSVLVISASFCVGFMLAVLLVLRCVGFAGFDLVGLLRGWVGWGGVW